ncbi:hypothetical protein E2C01_049688 [Portunus trituberculatus]|uniref:Uncharacterized protein n=1 Tax=Portunus trituberculatus TaxID=210409 RepID=A0A5B7GEJ1_PORTR|nr:hypothetical protein [Portunus trituberculatus]
MVLLPVYLQYPGSDMVTFNMFELRLLHWVIGKVQKWYMTSFLVKTAPDHDGPSRWQSPTASYVYPNGPMFTMTTPHQILGDDDLLACCSSQRCHLAKY